MWLLLCSSIVLNGCTDPKPTPEKNIRLPETEAEGITLQIEQNEKPLLKVRAGKMIKFQRPDSLFTLIRPQKPDSLVYVSLYDTQGKVRAEMQMQKLHYYDEPLRFEATGKIRVQSGEKSLSAQALTWNQADAQIVAKGFVQIQTPTERIEGYNLKANEDLSQYELYKTTGYFHINSSF